MDEISMGLLTEFINKTGFPIFAFLMMVGLYYKTVNKLSEGIDRLNTNMSKLIDCRKECVKNVK